MERINPNQPKPNRYQPYPVGSANDFRARAAYLALQALDDRENLPPLPKIARTMLTPEQVEALKDHVPSCMLATTKAIEGFIQHVEREINRRDLSYKPEGQGAPETMGFLHTYRTIELTYRDKLGTFLPGSNDSRSLKRWFTAAFGNLSLEILEKVSSDNIVYREKLLVVEEKAFQKEINNLESRLADEEVDNDDFNEEKQLLEECHIEMEAQTRKEIKQLDREQSPNDWVEATIDTFSQLYTQEEQETPKVFSDSLKLLKHYSMV